jgi:ATP-binding cassette subfamily B (MDR/TAP) protein 1
MIVGSFFAICFGSIMPIMTLIFGQLVDALNASNNKIRSEINGVALWFVYLGIFALVSAYLQNACWMTAAQRQITRLRTHYLKSLLEQEIGWFDATKSGELTTRIASDTILIHDAIGDKFAVLIQNMATFLSK